jgi:hypothetical protein
MRSGSGEVPRHGAEEVLITVTEWGLAGIADLSTDLSKRTRKASHRLGLHDRVLKLGVILALGKGDDGEVL